MAAGWTRRTFDADGVTEHPVGPNFQRLRSEFGGAVVLALDVSGSMSGDRIRKAVEGCHRFVEEAADAGYSVGVILWHHGIEDDVAPSSDPRAARGLLDRARASGGNKAVPFLTKAHEQLMALDVGDRVVAIFGDGDLGPQAAAERKAAELVADGIRILTCGLGEGSARELATISTEEAAPRTATNDTLADSIASMAQGLTLKKSSR
ncbi:MAG: VWA domain-containing protein [Aeromicrobium sp.]|uniref:vWA domain-containing protein n=1 Tax=Aeromicrobium sp. TaxID=1871063 RepID=UPI0039E4C1F0